MPNLHLVLRVNGEERSVSCPAQATLLEVLRENLALTGTKHGCELGECGACAVLVDGKPLLSCLTLTLECEGREIETIEGVAGDSADLHPLQSAFAKLVEQNTKRFPSVWRFDPAASEKIHAAIMASYARRNSGPNMRVR